MIDTRATISTEIPQNTPTRFLMFDMLFNIREAATDGVIEFTLLFQRFVFGIDVKLSAPC